MSRPSHPRAPDHLLTRRLFLRPLNRTDVGPYGRMFADRRVWTFIPPPYWKAGAQSRARSWRRLSRNGEAFHFVIRTRDKNDFVGEIALHHVDWERRLAELCHYAFQTLKLRRLEAITIDGNHASEAVLTKLGFRLEGSLRERDLVGKTWLAAHEFGLLRPEYRRRNSQRA